MTRVVLDTNVVLSALLFGHGNLAAVRHAWQAQIVLPLVSKATIEELMRVLTYPKFRLGKDEQRDLLAEYLPFCETVRIPSPAPLTPQCRDPFDVPFLELALAGQANFLVTGDRDLLTLGPTFACPIIEVEHLVTHLDAR
jgi:putative PIN family toxin of toxin-antitoxin system